MHFVQPLFELVDYEPEHLERVMTLGMLFWNLATLDDEREALLADLIERQALSAQGAAELREIAAAMIERHVEMFPELHAQRRATYAAAEG